MCELMEQSINVLSPGKRRLLHAHEEGFFLTYLFGRASVHDLVI